MLAPVLAVYVHEVDPETRARVPRAAHAATRTYRDAILTTSGWSSAGPLRSRTIRSAQFGLAAGRSTRRQLARLSHPGRSLGSLRLRRQTSRLVPAALKAARVLLATPRSARRRPPFGAADANLRRFGKARRRVLFASKFLKDTADSQAERYMRTQSFITSPPRPARPIVFNGISLDENGRVVPVMHSDEAF